MGIKANNLRDLAVATGLAFFFICLFYGTMLEVEAYQRGIENRKFILEIKAGILDLENRMDVTDANRRTYIQRFEKVETIEKERGFLLQRMMIRQADINKRLDAILDLEDFPGED